MKEAAIGGHHAARCNTEIVREYAQKLYEPHLHFPTTAIERRNMNIRRKSARAFISLPLALLLSTLGTGVAHAASPNTNGAAGQMPAFYDDTQFTVNMKEMPKGASPALIAHNRSINMIFATNDLDEDQDFIPVIDAIQGDGFNPLWQQVLIHFTGSAPHQFTSDDEVLAAADAGEITLEVTDEVYRCSVVGPGPKRPS